MIVTHVPVLKTEESPAQTKIAVSKRIKQNPYRGVHLKLENKWHDVATVIVFKTVNVYKLPK